MLNALERKQIELPDAKYDSATKSLASEASPLLGYNLFENKVFRDTGESTKLRALKAVFVQHGIEPFDSERVDAYKERMLRQKNRRTKIWQFFRGEWLAMPVFLNLAFGAIGCLVEVALLVYKFFRHQPIHLTWDVSLPVISLALFGLWLWAVEGERRELFSWWTYPLKNYTKAVPAFAIARAVELKRELPEAEFAVDELHGTYITADPFMVMEYRGQRYYIDVWDEPKFEGRRTK